MIEVQKIKIIENEIERAQIEALIAERSTYYSELFAAEAKPRIVIRFENISPFRAQITFHPPGRSPIKIAVESYSTPEIALKHGLKKLRRTAKNFYIKEKKKNRR